MQELDLKHCFNSKIQLYTKVLSYVINLQDSSRSHRHITCSLRTHSFLCCSQASHACIARLRRNQPWGLHTFYFILVFMRAKWKIKYVLNKNHPPPLCYWASHPPTTTVWQNPSSAVTVNYCVVVWLLKCEVAFMTPPSVEAKTNSQYWQFALILIEIYDI